MAISVVIVTHGRSADALCETVQMIIGEQHQLFAVDFLPGENIDSLVQKIKNLTLSGAVLFLVDFSGGSPFNAAALYSKYMKQCEVVTGVNIPMLVNVLIERDGVTTLAVLAELAKQSGSEGIIRLRTDFIIAEADEEDL